MAVLLSQSWAVTVNWKDVPTVAIDGELTTKWQAALGKTVMPDEPVIHVDTESFTDTVCDPALSSLTTKVPTPLVKVESGGSVACISELLKCTVPL